MIKNNAPPPTTTILIASDFESHQNENATMN